MKNPHKGNKAIDHILRASSGLGVCCYRFLCVGVGVCVCVCVTVCVCVCVPHNKPTQHNTSSRKESEVIFRRARLCWSSSTFIIFFSVICGIFIPGAVVWFTHLGLNSVGF
jgi:hypothetical protein